MKDEKISFNILFFIIIYYYSEMRGIINNFDCTNYKNKSYNLDFD